MPFNPRIKTAWRSPLFIAGAAVFVVGSGPLLFTIAREALDPAYAATRPNPIGFGCMAFLTFWPGIGMMIVGIVRWLAKKDA